MTEQKQKRMSQEIELKFIVSQPSVDALRTYLNTLRGHHQASRQLVNIYYETADNQLRRHDMGLRIRGDSGQYEMTMKVAGRVTGGLHQRPEYNVALTTPTLDLARFPSDVWPADMDIAALSAAVKPLFSTDFCREKWVVAHGESEIELAFDLGEVKAGEFHEPLCELELELLSGNTADLLALAQQLVAQPGLRQGSLSKAARGYHLAQGNVPRTLKPFTVLNVAAKASVEQALEAALECALAHWQYHEELWVRGDAAAKAEVQNALGLIRHALALFGGLVPRKASAHLRDLLTQCEHALSQPLPADSVAYSPQSGMAKLALTDWLISRGWQAHLDDKTRARLAGSFKRFADNHLSRHAAELKNAFAQPLGNHYSDQLPRLAREIDALSMLAGVYDRALSLPWLENWQGLRHAITTGQRIEIEHFRNEAISQAPFWQHSGKR